MPKRPKHLVTKRCGSCSGCRARPKTVCRAPRYYYRRRIDGAERTKCLGTIYPEAKRLAALEDARIQRRKLAGLSPTESTVAEFSQQWLRLYIARRRTDLGQMIAEQRLRDHILPSIGSLRVSEVRPIDLEELLARLRTGPLSVRSVHHVMSDVRCLFGYAVRSEVIAKSPWRPDLLPKVPEALPRSLSDEQIGRILGAERGRPSEFTIRFLLLTGIRRGELHRLSWRDVRWEVPCIELERTKSGKVRRVPLPSEAKALLRAEQARQRLSGHPSIFVLEDRRDRPTWINRNRKQSGVDWSPHQLRHTFAVRYLRAGGSLAVLQIILGHATVRMTQRYAQLSEAFVMSEAARIDLRVNTGEQTG